MAGSRRLAFAACWYWIRKLQARFVMPAITLPPSRPVRAADRCSGHRGRRSRSPSTISTPLSRVPGSATCRQQTSGTSTSTTWQPITGSSVWAEQLPRELREPRRAGRRRDRPHRRPGDRRRASVRTGHPVRPRQRLCPKRGARQRTGRALLRGARVREDRAVSISKRPARLPAVGRRRQGAAAR